MTALGTPELSGYSDILERMEHQPGTFTNDDRKSLYEQGAQLALLMRDFHDLRKDIRDNDSPTKEEFARLIGKVEALQNFRWYLMGIAVGAGLFTHLILSKIGL